MQLGASQTLAYSWEPFPSTGCLTSFDVRFVPGLIVSCCAVFSWCPWEAGSFLGRDGEVWGEGRYGGTDRSRGETLCSGYIV